MPKKERTLSELVYRYMSHDRMVGAGIFDAIPIMGGKPVMDPSDLESVRARLHHLGLPTAWDDDEYDLDRGIGTENFGRPTGD